LNDWSIEAFEVAVRDGTIGKYFGHCSWCLEKFHQISYSLSEHGGTDDEKYLLMTHGSRPGEREKND
jgi:hypothetical protein